MTLNQPHLRIQVENVIIPTECLMLNNRLELYFLELEENQEMRATLRPPFDVKQHGEPIYL